jgi:hypothetical protein
MSLRVPESLENTSKIYQLQATSPGRLRDLAFRNDLKTGGRQHAHQVIGRGGIAPQDHQGVAGPHFLEALPDVEQGKRNDGVPEIKGVHEITWH